MSLYQRTYQHAIEHPDMFWAEQAKRVPWYTPPSTILHYDEQQHARWFHDGELNICYAAIDYHVEQGRGDQPALYWDSPVTNSKQTLSYQALRDRVAHVAGGLAKLGVNKGDRVIIYMPMVPEAMIAMYACARLGAVHSVVFGGFAPHELAVRIDDAEPKVVIAASCGVEVDKVLPYKPIVDKAISLSSFKPDACVIYQRDVHRVELQPGDVDWQTLEAEALYVECVPVKATDPLYILYTSGTTGKPKGVVRDTGGYAVALAYSMEAIYGLNPGDVMFTASDVGWVVGHSYIVYAPLLRGCTTIVYEGKPVKTPDSGAFWRLIDEYKVKSFFTAPTAFRAIKKEDPEAKQLEQYDISSLQHLYVAGERLDPPTFHWLDDLLDVPVIDHWWQTETGWPVTAPCTGLGQTEVRGGSTNRPVPGYQVEVLDANSRPLGPDEEGAIVLRLPLPPGCAQTLWNDHPRYLDAYLNNHPGYYHTGDGGYLDADGFVYIMGRTDDVINVSGHRLSTGVMEEHIATHPAVAESAVVGMHDELCGEVPVGLVVLKDGADIDEPRLEQELVALIRDQVGAVARFRRALVVPRLPKTRSGKTLRAALRKMANGRDFPLPSTIDDPAILDEIAVVLSRDGLVPAPGKPQ